jgi:hypothetical protein
MESSPRNLCRLVSANPSCAIPQQPTAATHLPLAVEFTTVGQLQRLTWGRYLRPGDTPDSQLFSDTAFFFWFPKCPYGWRGQPLFTKTAATLYAELAAGTAPDRVASHPPPLDPPAAMPLAATVSFPSPFATSLASSSSMLDCQANPSSSSSSLPNNWDPLASDGGTVTEMEDSSGDSLPLGFLDEDDTQQPEDDKDPNYDPNDLFD